MSMGLKTAEVIEIQEALAREDVLDNLETACCPIKLALEQGSKPEIATAGEVLEWGAEYLHTPLVVVLSIQNTVLVELAARYAPEAGLTLLDTGYHFSGILDVVKQVAQWYNNRLLSVEPKCTRAEQDVEEGVDLYRTDPTRCCALRKVEPLSAVERLYEGWVTGPKCVDASTRAHTPVLGIDKTGHIKLNPLVTWTDEDVAQYIEDNDLIVCPLT